MTHRFSLAAALLAATCFTAACSQSEAATVAGTYSIDIEKTVNPIIAATPGADKMTAEQKDEMMNMMKGMFADASLTLKEDMSYESSANTQTGKSTLKGTWTISGGMITLNQTHQDDAEKQETHSGTIIDNVIAVEVDQAGKPVTMYFVKNTK
ncbi:MAG: hypothetical protein ACYTKC_08805 [Planctomycetota bacterium]|jgi:hypothetical protein